MQAAVIYSSVTGNTRTVAEAVQSVMPQGTLLFPVHKAPDPELFTFLALGFWVRRAGPDPRMIRYMGRVAGKTVAWFGTLAAWPDSPHADQVRTNAVRLLQGNTVLGGFLCQGRLEERRFNACMRGGGSHAAGHPMTDARRARLLEARHHPNEEDFTAARVTFSGFLAEWAAIRQPV